MNTADILRKAKAHISDPAMWHKGDYYKGWPHYDTTDFKDQPTDCPACAYGAVSAVTNMAEVPYPINALESAVSEIWPSVAEYNDHPDTTHADIMALFDRAIAIAEADQ